MRVFWPRHLDCAVCSAQCSAVVQCLPSSLRVVTLDGFKVCQTVSLSLWPLWPSAPAPAKTNNKTGDKVPIFAANNPHWDWMWPTGCQESRLTFRLVTSHRSSSSTSTVAPGFSENSEKNRNNLGTALLRHLTPSNNSHSILTTQNTHNFVGQQSAVNTAKIFGCSTN